MLAHQLQNRGDAGQTRAGFAREGFGDRLIGAFQAIGAIKPQVARDAIDDDFLLVGFCTKSHSTPGKEGQALQCDLDCCVRYDLANRNIQQVSLRVAKLMLPVPAASKEVHDNLILGFDIGWLGSQILRVVLHQDFDIILKSL